MDKAKVNIRNILDKKNKKKSRCKMKKILILTVILVNLILGVQGFSQITSKDFDKIMDKVSKEYDKGNKQKALSMLKKDILKNPSNLELKVFLGMIYEDMGKNNEAEKEFNEAVEMQKKYPFIAGDGKKYDIKLMIGSIYMSAKEYEKALKWFKKVDDKYMQDAAGLKEYMISTSNYALGNTEEAKKYLLKSYISDKKGDSEDLLGRIYDEEGNQKEALKWYLKAIKKGNSDAQADLGLLYTALGDNRKALQWFRKSLEEAKKEKDTEAIKELQDIIKNIESNN